MRKLFIAFIALLMLCSPIVLAEDAPATAEQKDADNLIVPAQETTEKETSESAGATPDKPLLWGIDRAFERIELALTFGRAAKAKKGLAFAKERLAEIKQMAEAKKLDALEKAQKKHKEIIEAVQQNIDSASVDNSEENLKLTAELESELDAHDEDLQKVESAIDLKIIGTLTEEQQKKVDELLKSIEASGQEARIRFNAKKDKAVIKYKTEFEKTDKEVQEKLKEIREKIKSPELQAKLNEKAVEILTGKIAKLEELANKAKEKGKDVSLLETRLAEAKALVEEIKAKTSYDEARELIQKAHQLLNFRQVYTAVNAEKVKEKLHQLESQRIELKKEIKELKLKKTALIRVKPSEAETQEQPRIESSEPAEEGTATADTTTAQQSE